MPFETTQTQTFARINIPNTSPASKFTQHKVIYRLDLYVFYYLVYFVLKCNSAPLADWLFGTSVPCRRSLWSVVTQHSAWCLAWPYLVLKCNINSIWSNNFLGVFMEPNVVTKHPAWFSVRNSLQNKWTNCREAKNNINFGQITGIQVKPDRTYK